jgi:hypothetical protein
MVCRHLLLGPSFDAHVELVAERLRAIGCSVEHLLTDGPLPDLDTLAARPPLHALFRRAQTGGHPDPGIDAYMSAELLEYATALGDLTPHWHWFPGTPAQVRRAGSKPVQLAAARRAGLTVPRTVITSDPIAIAGLDRADWVMKPLRSQTVTLAGEHRWLGTSALAADDATLLPAPVIVQQRLERATEVRVFVAGTTARAFAVEVPTVGYADLKDVVDEARYRRIDLPADVEAPLRWVMSELSSPLACADFVIDSAGDWWFLELNPNGQWYFLQEDAGTDLMSPYVAALHGPRERN